LFIDYSIPYAILSIHSGPRADDRVVCEVRAARELLKAIRTEALRKDLVAGWLIGSGDAEGVALTGGEVLQGVVASGVFSCHVLA
jgi:hypothetical protein